MTDFPQEAGPRTMPHSSRDYPFPVGLSDVTSDINGGPESLPFAGESDPLQQTREIVPEIANRCVAEQTEKLLSILGQMMEAIKKERPQLSDIPPLHAHIDEDGSVLIEWIFPDFRAGFNIEPNSEDSGWYLVSNKKISEIAMSGALANIYERIALLLNFILANI